MVTRVTNPSFLRGKEPPGAVGFNPEELVKEPNILLRQGRDLALFEYTDPYEYRGHYFFSSRGKKALESASIILQDLFFLRGAMKVTGLVPIENKKSIWFSLRLGFEDHGIENTQAGQVKRLSLTRADYINKDIYYG